MEAISKYRELRYNFFKRQYESAFAYKFALALLFAGLTGIGAQVKIYLPFTPVPITGQVFFVLLTGVLLGRYAGVSQGLYVALGAAGVPWFAPKAGMPAFSNGGLSVVTGVTGGYLIGFIAAAAIIGYFVEKFVSSRAAIFQFCLLLFGVAVIYALGALQLSLILGTGFQETMLLAVLPFIPGDIIKALGVFALAVALLPKEAYNGELDAGSKKTFKLPGVALTLLLASFFLVLFWLKALELQEVSAYQFLSQTAWFTLPFLLSAAMLIKLLTIK
jgi:biotin transport system substrate-specific component